MRIVQTFWTAGHNPLEYGFGWPHAEYNLMSWALSCLSLREHYDEVVLYTDSAGKRILIDELHLPYTDVQVVFDDFPCLPQHWALAKIKTYSLQTKPFLHVDGDIFVPHPLPEEVLAAPLIAQNREIGTVYYRQMMNRVLSYPEILIPEFVQKPLSEESIASYNMGFFGGFDLEFIRSYCDKAFLFIEENRMNDPSERCSRVTCNIFFEQIFFAALADGEGREVASVLGKPMIDKGYTRQEFCDLQHYETHPFHHILNGHKRNREVLMALEHLMLRRAPELYWQIMMLFPVKNIRFASGHIVRMRIPVMNASGEQLWNHYMPFVQSKSNEWRRLPLEELKKMATGIAYYTDFADGTLAEQDTRLLHTNPYVSVYMVTEDEREPLKIRLGCNAEYPLCAVAMIPTASGEGHQEIPLVDFEVKIIQSVQRQTCTFAELFTIMFGHMKLDDAGREGARMHLYGAIVSLMQNGIIL